MKLSPAEIGKYGEAIATQFLKSQGFIILERNYYQPWGEIDIVCKKGRKLYFVEVKGVAHETRAMLEESVLHGTHVIHERIDHDKLKKLHSVIKTYCLDRDFRGKYQIDAFFVHLVPYETYAAVDIVSDIENELTQWDDWDML